jgi:hypothetical protein
MRALFARWIWPESLADPFPHGLGTLEQPAVLVHGGTSP